MQCPRFARFSICFPTAIAVTMLGAPRTARADTPTAPEPAPATTALPPAAPSLAATFDHKPKKPNEPISLQLEDADLSELVHVIGEVTGKKFVFANAKLAKVKASIFAPQKVSVAEAYQAFLAVLTANGLTVVPHAGFHRIVESQDVARQLTPVERGELSSDERYVTRIHRLAHLSAEEVAGTVLAKLQTKDANIVPFNGLLIITETAANLRRMLDVLALIDEGGEEDKLWFRSVEHLSSAQLEKQLSDLLGLKGRGDTKRDGPPATSATGSGDALHLARIVALERPNAIVVIGARRTPSARQGSNASR